MSYVLNALKREEDSGDAASIAAQAYQQNQSKRNTIVIIVVVAVLALNLALGAWYILSQQEAPASNQLAAAPSTSQPAANTVSPPQPASSAHSTPATRRPPIARPPQRRQVVPPTPAPRSTAPATNQSQGRVIHEMSADTPAEIEGEQVLIAPRRPGPTGLRRRAAPANEAVQTAPAPVPAWQQDGRPVVTLANASERAKSTLDGFEYSSHIYADDADLRWVVINGEKLVEGDRASGWQLLAITAEGMVWDNEDERVSVSILEQWGE